MTLFNCCDGPTDIYLFHSSSFASLRSKRFRAVSEQGSREKWLSFHFSRGQNRESRSSVFLCSETARKRLLRRLFICKKVILTDKRIWARDLSQMTRSKKQKTNELHVKWLKRWKSIYKYFLITGYTCTFFSYYSLQSCWDNYFKVAGRLNHSKKRRLAVNEGKHQR